MPKEPWAKGKKRGVKKNVSNSFSPYLTVHQTASTLKSAFAEAVSPLPSVTVQDTLNVAVCGGGGGGVGGSGLLCVVDKVPVL